ncbi:MAG: GrpB family protein [Acidimicrobiales bacterium]
MNDRPIVEDPNPEWARWFKEIDAYVAPFLGDAVVRIEHVGSTSVPDLSAKPIIDIDVVVADERQIKPTIDLIESAGYHWVGNLNVEGREAFESPTEPTLPAHHLYLVVLDNRAHSDHWLFRDALLSDREARDRYGSLKRENVSLSKGDMDRYVALKAAFVAEILSRARAKRGLHAVAYWEPDLG